MRALQAAWLEHLRRLRVLRQKATFPLARRDAARPAQRPAGSRALAAAGERQLAALPALGWAPRAVPQLALQE